MTARIDRFWVELGVNATELEALTARRAIYACMIMMTATSLCLLGGIVGNLVPFAA